MRKFTLCPIGPISFKKIHTDEAVNQIMYARWNSEEEEAKYSRAYANWAAFLKAGNQCSETGET